MQPNRVIPRIVLDTDALVGAAYAKNSASRRIVEACIQGEVCAVASPALRAEYEHIVQRAVKRQDFGETFKQFLASVESVHPIDTPRVVPDDPDDDKLIAAAIAGRAEAVVTNDRHLLQLDPYGELRIVRPTEFIRLTQQQRATP